MKEVKQIDMKTKMELGWSAETDTGIFFTGCPSNRDHDGAVIGTSIC